MNKVSTFIISQYYDSKNLRGVLDAYEDLLQKNIGDQLPKLKNQMTIRATGIWLDMLAARFAISRPLLPDGESPVYFGLVTDGADTDGKGTFGVAPFVPDGGSATAGHRPASDASFALMIRMVASALINDGTQDSVSNILDGVFAESFVVDNQDMTASLYIILSGSENDRNIIMGNLNILPKPAGVRFDVERFTYFGFSSEDSSFDDGPFQD
jgi:hypothetical protein